MRTINVAPTTIAHGILPEVSTENTFLQCGFEVTC